MDEAEAEASLQQRFLVHFAQCWLELRLPELKAVAALEGVSLHILPADEAALPQGVVLPVRSAAGEVGLARAAARSVLVKNVLEEWGSGYSWPELTTSLSTFPSERAEPFLRGDSTYRIRVAACGMSCPESEQLVYIRSLGSVLEWRGKVRLKAPDHRFLLIIEHVEGAPKSPPQPRGASSQISSDVGAAVSQSGRFRFRFGRVVARGQRDLTTKFALKRRAYIGSTSLDAELSFVMANLARVCAGSVVFDPYCGTASTLLSAAAFGGQVLGCDVHRGVLAGEVRIVSGRRARSRTGPLSIGLSFAQYGLPQPLGLMHADSGRLGSCLRPQATGLFDAIITDPPYGIRERRAVVSQSTLPSDPRTPIAEETAHAAPPPANDASVAQGTALGNTLPQLGGSDCLAPLERGWARWSLLRSSSAPMGVTSELAGSSTSSGASGGTCTTVAHAGGHTHAGLGSAPSPDTPHLGHNTGAAPTLPPKLPLHVASASLAPHTSSTGLETILKDLFSIAAATLSSTGRLVFLLPTTMPFSAALLPPHPGLSLEGESNSCLPHYLTPTSYHVPLTLLRPLTRHGLSLAGAYEERVSYTWSRWCVVMQRIHRHGAEGLNATREQGGMAGCNLSQATDHSGGGIVSDLATLHSDAHGSGVERLFERSAVRPGQSASIKRKQKEGRTRRRAEVDSSTGI